MGTGGGRPKTGEAQERSLAEARGKAVKVDTSKGKTTRGGASDASAKHVKRHQRVQPMLTSSKPSAAQAGSTARRTPEAERSLGLRLGRNLRRDGSPWTAPA